MHLNLTESCAEAGIYATSEAERAYWLSREKSYLTASVEIDVHAFHDALGLMYPQITARDLSIRLQPLCLQSASRPDLKVRGFL